MCNTALISRMKGGTNKVLEGNDIELAAVYSGGDEIWNLLLDYREF